MLIGMRVTAERDGRVSLWDRPPHGHSLPPENCRMPGPSNLLFAQDHDFPASALASSSAAVPLPPSRRAPPLSPSLPGASYPRLHNVDAPNKIPHSLCPTGQRSFPKTHQPLTQPSSRAPKAIEDVSEHLLWEHSIGPKLK